MVRQEKQITVCLLQTMIGRYHEFTSGYFDVVVMDECHRSIYGAWQTALSYFDALHIGLTATPAMYIERNTFQFYHCKDDTPDYSYPSRRLSGRAPRALQIRHRHHHAGVRGRQRR
jgi:type I restriction enzyme R subunit